MTFWYFRRKHERQCTFGIDINPENDRKCYLIISFGNLIHSAISFNYKFRPDRRNFELLAYKERVIAC